MFVRESEWVDEACIKHAFYLPSLPGIIGAAAKVVIKFHDGDKLVLEGDDAEPLWKVVAYYLKRRDEISLRIEYEKKEISDAQSERT